MAKTLYDKLWDSHQIIQTLDGLSLIYIDRHLIHEVTSPQAFSGLALAGRKPWRVATNLATEDHNVPTQNRDKIVDSGSKLSLEELDKNCKAAGIVKFNMGDPRQGIVHVIGPEQGATLPGMTIVCGDSHTSTNGALGALAFGIGTSEVEQVLATQCLLLRKVGNMRINVSGELSFGVSAKDLILAVIGRIGTAGATGYALEFSGEGIASLSMEARMTVCNMSIEAGSRYGMIGVDKKTIDYVKGRPYTPTGQLWEQAVESWTDLHSDAEAHFDRKVDIIGYEIQPQVTWGTAPDMVVEVGGQVPDPSAEQDAVKREGMEHALRYMELEPGISIVDIKLDKIFIGSCTNSRIEDLREAAVILKGRKVADTIRQSLVVPGSGLVKRQAEQEGLADIFIDSGFEWREPGCSMCLAMNEDRLLPGERCASTSNRNFEGRQGQGGRTHLVSPAMAAAASVAGHFVDVREFSKTT